MSSESQHEETGIKSVFTILGIYSRWRTTRIWRQGIYMVPMIRMESGWEKDHRMSHTEGVGNASLRALDLQSD